MDHNVPQHSVLRDEVAESEDSELSRMEPGARVALVILDLATNFTGCYALKSKSADDAYNAIQHFTGSKYLQYVYTDNSQELTTPVGDLGFPHATSTPGVHETTPGWRGEMKLSLCVPGRCLSTPASRDVSGLWLRPIVTMP
jgi:hypothetical protein